MGLAFDTVLANAVNPGAGGGTATVTASGDSLSIRNFPSANAAYLEGLTRMGTTAGLAQIRSPLLHDNVQGIRITPGESPSYYSIPSDAQQMLQAQDTLVITIGGGSSETDIAILYIYYTNLPGAAARLCNPSDLAGNIKYLKPIQVAVTSSPTIGAWLDTVITTTEDLTHANKDYAVLGYTSNTALGVIGIKGIDTGNLRAAGPGNSTNEFTTTRYFEWLSEQTGRPHIPVWNAANKNGTYVSVAAATASVAATVELMCVELVNNFASVS
jgi:hypothetical protein